MIFGLQSIASLFKRRPVATAANAAPAPAGMVALHPGDTEEYSRIQARMKASTPRMPDSTPAKVSTPAKTEAQPSVAASTETPKPAPKPEPIAQASVKPVQKTATPKPAIASTPGKVTVATSATPAKGSCTGSIRLGNFRLNRSEAREVAFSSVYGIARDVSELCDPYDSQWNLRDAPRVLAATMKDAVKIRANLTGLSSKPRKGSAQHHWTDHFSVMSLNASNDPSFIEKALIDEARKANADLILVLERASTLVAFGDPDRMQFAFDRIAQATGSAVGILRSVKDC